jgi:hypothetical protein
LIDFRYHIVSIIAVFLALGVGILVGTTVLDAATVGLLRQNVGRLRSDLTATRKAITDLRSERDQANAIVDQITPYVVGERLEGRRILLVYDGQSGRWRDVIRDGIVKAGAEPVGSISLTDGWKLEAPQAPENLAAAIHATIGAFDPGQSASETALDLLGRRLFESDGRELLRRLSDLALLTYDAPAPTRAAWPPDGALVLAFASPFPKTAPNPRWLAAFAKGSSQATATLLASATPDDYGAVTLIREAGGSVPNLSTFDAGSSAYSQLGAVLALEAAASGRGGHFGEARGRRLVPDRP